MYKKNKPAKLTLAHINDTHSYFEPHSLQLELTIGDETVSPYVSNGGFARVATRARQIKKEAAEKGRDFLFFHGGDCFQGTLYFSLFKGKANADLLNAIGIDAMALGNHELDMGNQPVAQFLDRITFPVMAGNWDVSGEEQGKTHSLKNRDNLYSYDPEKLCAKWMIKEISGEPVAIFGVSMDQMEEIANPDPDTVFRNTLSTVINTISEIRACGINKIILLSHLGFDADVQLAEQVDGIGLIVGGHSHTLQGDFSSLGLENGGEYGFKVNGTHIVQSGLYAQGIGHCEIDFDEWGEVIRFEGRNELLLGRRLCIDASLSTVNTDLQHRKAFDYLRAHSNVCICKKAPDVHAIIQEKYLPRVRELQKTVIGSVNKPLRHVRIPDSKGGSEIVPLVAESFYHVMHENGFEVEFAMHNAGGVRCSLNPGQVTVADIAGKLLPFAVPIGIYRIKGRYLALALEGAINNATNNGVTGTGSGSYPYVFNLDYTYDPEAEPGQRVRDLKLYTDTLGWQNVEDDKVYTGTSSAYTMKGKEGYSAITQMEGSGVVTNFSMADCFIELLKNQPDKLGAGCENEIQMVKS